MCINERVWGRGGSVWSMRACVNKSAGILLSVSEENQKERQKVSGFIYLLGGISLGLGSRDVIIGYFHHGSIKLYHISFVSSTVPLHFTIHSVCV